MTLLRGNDLTLFGIHLGSGCLDNTTDPGWCVWCGREILPPGDEPKVEPVPAPVSAPVGTPIPVAMVVYPKPEPAAPVSKPPAWYVRMFAARRAGRGG